MKVVKIVIRILGILILAGIVAFVFLLRHITHRAIPDYNQDVYLEGLSSEVEVFRDTFGIPHIYADTPEDLYRATGYVMAMDRMWQMDLLRRVAQGRLSEILGEDMVGTDQLFRSLRIEDKSKRIMRQTEPEIMACVKAFSDGINQYLRDFEKKLPFEFAVLGYKPDPWEAIHTVNLIGYMSWSSSAAWNNETGLYKVMQLIDSARSAELIPYFDPGASIIPDFMVKEELHPSMELLSNADVMKEFGLDVFTASNNWVVEGERSFNGTPILANDMHLQLNIAPGVWYQMHQVIRGEMNVSGMVLPGTPFVNVGHNDSIAWGMTYVGVDDIDFYAETINPADTNLYLYNGHWEELEVREEKIRIKGGDSTIVYNRFTHRGPVVNTYRNIPEQAISMRWTGNEYSNEIKTAYLFNRSRNIMDFREALRTWTTISCNAVVADVSGDIAMFVAAGVPIREGNRALVMPGNSGRYEWIGFVPFEHLPHRINPPQGFLASANNRSAGDDYQYHISHWFGSPYRFNRIKQMIGEKQIFTVQDMMEMQADQVSWHAKSYMQKFGPVLDTAELRGSALAAYDRIHAWDHHMDPEGIQATLMTVFSHMLREAVFRDELDDKYRSHISGIGVSSSSVMRRLIEGDTLLWADDVRTEDVTETINDLVVPAWNSAVKWLENRYGEDMDAWVWGDLHTVSLKHPLAASEILNRVFKLERGPYRVGGNGNTVCPYSHPGLSSFSVTSGASTRHVHNLLNPDDTRVIMPSGVSGIPASPFFCNQTDMYMRNEYITESFSREKVERTAVYHSILSKRKPVE